MRRRLVHGLALAGVVLFGAAHVGNNVTVFEGRAGPYAVRVIVRTPGVVPGLAAITVRILSGDGVPVITALPLRGGRPTALDPPPDTARAVPGDARLFDTQLWLMESGAYSIRVEVAGSAGRGSVLVPVNAVATQRLGLATPLAIALAGLGLFLVAGALTIVHAAVRESTLAPDALPDGRRRRRALVAAAVTLPIVALGLWGGNRWWQAEDARFQSSIYHPLRVTTTITSHGALRLVISDSTWLGGRGARQWTPLIPDHGKLMHLFLIGDEPGAFAHLHPLMRDSASFDASLPPLPPGRYRLFADIVHESGFTQTLQDSIAVGPAEPARWVPTDRDDSYGAPAPARAPGDTVVLADGSTMVWSRAERLEAGREAELRFVIAGPHGGPPNLEPYLGMAAHAAVMREDGAVFGHLHPLGTISPASQLVYELRQPGDTLPGRLGRRITALETQGQGHAPMDVTDQAGGGTVRIPYVFPQPGRYRLWVQVRRRGGPGGGGGVLTGAFTAVVATAVPAR